jgi:hypothetical protein
VPRLTPTPTSGPRFSERAIACLRLVPASTNWTATFGRRTVVDAVGMSMEVIRPTGFRTHFGVES